MTDKHAMTPDEVGEYYDDRSWLYEMFMGHNLHIGFWDDDDPDADPKDRLTDVLLGELDLGAGDRLLDVGCGPGRPAIRAAQRTGAEVVGITVSSEQVETGNRLAAEAELAGRVRFEHADAMRLPYPDASFDAAWAVESIMYLSDRPAAVREIRRVLRPGGVFVLSDYTERTVLTPDQRAVLADGFTVDSLPTEQGYRRMIEEAGLTVLRTTDATAQLRRSVERTEQIVGENHDRIVERGGADFAAEFQGMIAQVIALEREQLGYAIVKSAKAAR
ncbi:cyclopropane-fatty-acyl-phospholipid synthase family protein [Saccharopolyspora gloriosae]|uniref:SAM-dependent methyltransferase n=1 Tax=Saccharopolyspora gloriosae TaxID=455344 RepID=UPI001FB6A1E1|nr:class I SAM-dependent methyltransferase [Saccharopolyspora gloriosae]